MRLLDIQRGKKTDTEGVFDLVVTADVGNGPETLPFTYVPGDPFGLGPAIAAWLDANPGLVIDDYVPPVKPMPTLEAYQLYAVLELAGHKTSLANLVNTLPPSQQIVARNKIAYIRFYERNNPLISTIQAGLGLTTAQMDQLWWQAADIK